MTAELQRLTIQPAFEYADSAFFCLFNTVVFLCFVAFRPNVPLVFFFFCEICGRIGNDMHRKRKIGHEKVGSIGQKKMEMHIPSRGVRVKMDENQDWGEESIAGVTRRIKADSFVDFIDTARPPMVIGRRGRGHPARSAPRHRGLDGTVVPEIISGR